MNDKWKAFWMGVLAAIGGALGLVAILRKRTTPVKTPERIASDAKEKIDAVREEIKDDTDEELKNRFNTLAKKQARKKDEK